MADKHPAEISWCHIHRVARDEPGCAACLEETGGYSTTLYVLKESGSEMERAIAQARQQWEDELLSDEVLDAVTARKMPMGEARAPMLWNRIRNGAEADLRAALAATKKGGE